MIFFNVMLYLANVVIWTGGRPPDYGGLIFALMLIVIGFMWLAIKVIGARRKWRVAQPARVQGKWLTAHAEICGLKRRWFGLEPDFILRKRVLQVFKMKGKTPSPYLY